MTAPLLVCLRDSEDFKDARYVWRDQADGRLDGLRRASVAIETMYFQYCHRPRGSESKGEVMWLLKLGDDDAAEACRVMLHSSPTLVLQSFGELRKRFFPCCCINVGCWLQSWRGSISTDPDAVQRDLLPRKKFLLREYAPGHQSLSNRTQTRQHLDAHREGSTVFA